MSSELSLFPPQTPSYILNFQFSSWYPTFSSITIKSTIIRPLSQEFIDYLNSDGVFVPEGSENIPAESTLSDDEPSDEEEETDQENEKPRRYAFPELDEKIRECVCNYEAVFPKLNFSSPKDASWVLPASSPLKCIIPADVYLLLKSSDFITHDIDPDNVFQQCEASEQDKKEYDLELVLRKWYAIDTSREIRCFVRQQKLLAISQRDNNYYDFLNDPSTQNKIKTSVINFWETHILHKWTFQQDYTFDLLLTRDLERGHIVDFNPFSPRTDPLLFTYEELRDILSNEDAPVIRVIDSRSHPNANLNTPAYQHNMIPFEALQLSEGKNIAEFSDLWKEYIKESTQP